MPPQVKRDFADATREVTLDQTGLGIVKAALARRPAVAVLDAADLGASAGWLARFAAERSLAVPVERQGMVTGVIAVSTAQPVDPDGPTWAVLIAIAARLSGVL